MSSAPATPRSSPTDLPPRVRKLLSGLLELVMERLGPLIEQCSEDFERELFASAERAAEGGAQQRCFETLHAFRSKRVELVPFFRAGLEQSLFRLGQARAEDLVAGTRCAELSLVSEAEIEIATAIAESGGRAEVRASAPLYLLGQRFGVLAAAPAFDADRLPVGPRALARLLISALADIDMPLSHRLLLLRQFERQFLPLASAFYEAINAYLVAERVLPHLSFAPLRRGATATAMQGRGSQREPAGDGENGPARATAASLCAPQRPPSASPTAARRLAAPASPLSGSIPPPTWLGMPRPAVAEEDDLLASEVLTTLRALLAARRQRTDRAGTRPRAANAHLVSRRDIDEALKTLQRRSAAPIYVGGRIQAPSMQHVKQDLLAQLRGRVPAGHLPQLSEEEADTIDLLGMLFEQIMRDLKPNGPARFLLAKLQVPLLRIALTDTSFFTRRNHPARRFLNTVAEMSLYWLDGEEPEHELLDKMHHLVDRVNAEFDGDLSLFEKALEDLSGCLRTLVRRAEVAERRHVEAARGRERLELARERAAAAIAARTEGRQLPNILSQVLEQTWTDVLALTELRHGPDAPVYRQRLDLADALIALADGASPQPTPETLAQWRDDLEKGLTLVGLTPADAQVVVRALFAKLGQRSAADGELDSSPTSELSVRIPTNGRVGSREAPGKPEESPPTPEEQAMIDWIKTLPLGTWVEFVVNAQGDRVRRRLSWFSPLTGRCLFVNQRGQKVDERSLVSFARNLLRGDATIIEVHGESLIDRAWQRTLDMLERGEGGAALLRPGESY